MAEHNEVKTIQVRIHKEEEKLRRLFTERQEITREYDRCVVRLKQLREKLYELTHQPDKVILSEHALLRYLERVSKIDLEAIRHQLLPPALELEIRTLGDGFFPAPGCRLVVKQGIVVTVETDETGAELTLFPETTRSPA